MMMRTATFAAVVAVFAAALAWVACLEPVRAQAPEERRIGDMILLPPGSGPEYDLLAPPDLAPPPPLFAPPPPDVDGVPDGWPGFEPRYPRYPDSERPGMVLVVNIMLVITDDYYQRVHDGDFTAACNTVKGWLDTINHQILPQSGVVGVYTQHSDELGRDFQFWVAEGREDGCTYWDMNNRYGYSTLSDDTHPLDHAVEDPWLMAERDRMDADLVVFVTDRSFGEFDADCGGRAYTPIGQWWDPWQRYVKADSPEYAFAWVVACDSSYPENTNVTTMAHEIGHVFGLQHDRAKVSSQIWTVGTGVWWTSVRPTYAFGFVNCGRSLRSIMSSFRCGIYHTSPYFSNPDIDGEGNFLNQCARGRTNRCSPDQDPTPGYYAFGFGGWTPRAEWELPTPHFTSETSRGPANAVQALREAAYDVHMYRHRLHPTSEPEPEPEPETGPEPETVTFGCDAAPPDRCFFRLLRSTRTTRFEMNAGARRSIRDVIPGQTRYMVSINTWPPRNWDDCTPTGVWCKRSYVRSGYNN